VTFGHKLLRVSLLLSACLGLASLSTKAASRPSTASLDVLSCQVFLPVARKGACTSHTCSMTLSATPTTPRVGDTIQVIVRLYNHGCGFLGLPLYRLTWDLNDSPPVFDQTPPLEMLHSVAIFPGEYDEATFVLQAAGPGKTELQTHCSIEVHLGYPGPAYWSACSAPPLTITVAP
jgi:hypothetical protein